MTNKKKTNGQKMGYDRVHISPSRPIPVFWNRGKLKLIPKLIQSR